MSVIQAPPAVVMVRPHRFKPNPETAPDNGFQSRPIADESEISRCALAEFDAAVATLKQAGVRVHVFDDDGTRNTPDSVFPNNWFSTHAGGHVAIFPMFAASRRRERRWDIIEFLKQTYRVQDVVDYSGLELDGLSLEGTGAMVLDHLARVAYSSRSNRSDPIILERFCAHFNYEPIVFDAVDESGLPVYHTNVLMCIATDFAMIGLRMIPDATRRAEIAERLTEHGRDLIDLTPDQVGAFAANAMELTGRNGRILALSATAYHALSSHQRAHIERKVELLPLHIPTLEAAGGSVRCMLAGIHLAKRPQRLLVPDHVGGQRDISSTGWIHAPRVRGVGELVGLTEGHQLGNIGPHCVDGEAGAPEGALGGPISELPGRDAF